MERPAPLLLPLDCYVLSPQGSTATGDFELILVRQSADNPKRDNRQRYRHDQFRIQHQSRHCRGTPHGYGGYMVPCHVDLFLYSRFKYDVSVDRVMKLMAPRPPLAMASISFIPRGRRGNLAVNVPKPSKAVLHDHKILTPKSIRSCGSPASSVRRS